MGYIWYCYKWRGILCVLLLAGAASGCDGSYEGIPQYGGLIPMNGNIGNSPTYEAFENAQPQSIYTNRLVSFGGNILHSQDIHVWDLGSVASGARLTFDVLGDNNNLSLGLFDSHYEVLQIGHNRLNSYDPYAVYITTMPMDHLYLAISSDPNEASHGNYVAQVMYALIEDPAESRTYVQHVVLNFEGKNNVSVGNAPIIDIPVFDAADLYGSWRSHTEEMKRIVFDHMVRMYTGLNVEFHYADEELDPEYEYTWVHFGGEDNNNVGLADRIDYGNGVLEEKCVVYTQNFAKYANYGYSHEDLAIGFANVAAHELGHLLGLNHTDQPADVMNVSPTVAALLTPQYFVASPGLDSRVFKVGFQDGAERIYLTVGGDWDTISQARMNSEAAYAQSQPQPAEFNPHGLATTHSHDVSHESHQDEGQHKPRAHLCEYKIPGQLGD